MIRVITLLGYCRFSATSSIKHLAVSELPIISARIIGTCNLTGQCFEIGNKNIPPIRYLRAL